MNALSIEILGPAFVAGLLILATHVPLGSIVLSRGIIFIDIALAQVAALGVVFGNMMFGASSGWIVQLSAFGAAVGSAFLLNWTDKRFPAVQEAIIGVLYIVAASVQIVFLSFTASGSEHLKELLVGQILWVTPGQLLIVGLVYAAVVALWYFRDLQQERLLFYAAFAVVITASVQVVGVLLVFSSLIVPALATRSAPERWRLVIAFNVGAAGYALGLCVSAILDISTGAAIVCAMVLVALGYACAAPLFARNRDGEIHASRTAVERGH